MIVPFFTAAGSSPYFKDERENSFTYFDLGFVSETSMINLLVDYNDFFGLDHWFGFFCGSQLMALTALRSLYLR